MGRTTFVAWLFIMAAACVVIAVSDRSWAWLIGALVFFAVATLARRRFKEEQETGRAPPQLSFLGLAMLGMLVAMAFLFWIQFSA